MLRELVPSDLIKIQSANDWKRIIVAAYNQDAGMTPEDAKITFLKIVYRWVVALLFIFGGWLGYNCDSSTGGPLSDPRSSR